MAEDPRDFLAEFEARVDEQTGGSTPQETERTLPEPAERWRRRPIPAAVEHSDGVINMGDDRRAADINVTWDDEAIGRIKAGYQCLRCWEPFETAFPDACGVCGYGVSDFQARDFAFEFEGKKHIGPSTSIQQELERLDEKSKRPFSSIAVPKKIWTPGDAA